MLLFGGNGGGVHKSVHLFGTFCKSIFQNKNYFPPKKLIVCKKRNCYSVMFIAASLTIA